MAKKKEKNDRFFCSFCGKNQKEVEKLIAGPSVYICNECIKLCSEIIEEESISIEKANAKSNLNNISDIKKHLDEKIVGHNSVKNKIAACLCMHLKKKQLVGKEKFTSSLKNNILLIGPAGSGKNEFAKAMADLCGLPYAEEKASNLKENGFVEERDLFSKLIVNADFDIERASKGIVYLDYIDKLVSITPNEKNENIQLKLMGLMDGSTVKIQPQRNLKNSETVELDTTNILFVFGGTFTNSIDKNSIVNHEKYGLLKEFIARIPTIIQLNDFTVDDYIELMHHPKQSPIIEYKKLSRNDNIEIEFTGDAIEQIAKLAFKQKNGLFGLNNLLDNLYLTLLLENSQNTDTTIKVTSDMVNQCFSR